MNLAMAGEANTRGKAGPDFPDPTTARSDGLVFVGGDLSVPRLLTAYRSGIFPWTTHPITWWSPDPRAVFEIDAFEPPRSLARVVRRGLFDVTVDDAFREVIEACAEPGPGRGSTWISPEFIKAYTRLHEEGWAHSIECWQEGKLVGGIYGVGVGGFFAGESMFHRVSDASKVALCQLIGRLRERGFELFDIQMLTPITEQLGAVEISRTEYLSRLRRALEKKCSFS